MDRISKNISKIFILLLVLSLILIGCNSNDVIEDNKSEEPTNIGQEQKENEDKLILVREQKFVLGTLGAIDTYSETKEDGEKAISLAFERIEEIENLMSTSIEGSDVYNINKNAGIEATKIDPATMNIILEGIKHHDITKETFNIGLGSLINLWGIGTDAQKIPTTEEITNAKKHIDLNQIEVSEENNTVFLKDPKMLLDLGGIAKGYAVDEAIRVLKENEIESGLVNLGGDIFIFGMKDDDSLWRVGVNNPETGGGGNPIARILMTDKSIVTSGNYERYFIEDNVRYHHIIDPNTGMPADNGVTGVTIISDQCLNSDIISTAVFILGVDKGLELIENQPGTEGLIITEDRSIYVSSGLKDDLEVLDKQFKITN